jgi:hypothetical protein
MQVSGDSPTDIQAPSASFPYLKAGDTITIAGQRAHIESIRDTTPKDESGYATGFPSFEILASAVAEPSDITHGGEVE